MKDGKEVQCCDFMWIRSSNRLKENSTSRRLRRRSWLRSCFHFTRHCWCSFCLFACYCGKEMRGMNRSSEGKEKLEAPSSRFTFSNRRSLAPWLRPPLLCPFSVVCVGVGVLLVVSISMRSPSDAITAQPVGPPSFFTTTAPLLHTSKSGGEQKKAREFSAMTVVCLVGPAVLLASSSQNSLHASHTPLHA
jgi:hypothetical protein